MIRHDALRLLLLCGAHPPDTPESPGSDALPGSNTALSSWQSRHLISGAPILQSTPCSLSWPSSCALTFALLSYATDRMGRTPSLMLAGGAWLFAGIAALICVVTSVWQ